MNEAEAVLHALRYPECHEGVTRQGEFQPCDRPAVALRRDMGEGFGTPYPVCVKHARGPMVRLHEIATAVGVT